MSRQYYSPGTRLFLDNAFLYASSCEEDEETELNSLKRYKSFQSHSKMNIKKIKKFIDDFSQEERVQSYDIARCFLQGITIAMKPQSDDEIANMMKLSLLQPANLERCIETVEQIRMRHPNIIPSSITNEIAGRLLGILNNNQMELERFGGTGLFLNGCLCEHSCLPNSSYSTDYDPDTGVHTFSLVAIRDIHPGRVIIASVCVTSLLSFLCLPPIPHRRSPLH
jgi:hypothetical protein